MRIKMSKKTDPKMIQAIGRLIVTPGQGGLHIVIEDGNIEDDDIQWCLDNTIKTEKVREIANYLLSLNPLARLSALYKAFFLVINNKLEPEHEETK